MTELPHLEEPGTGDGDGDGYGDRDGEPAPEALGRWSFARTLVDASPAFFVAIGGDGKTLLMNAAMLRALGYTLDEVLGTDYLATFVPEDERQAVADVLARRRASGGPSVIQNSVLARDGRKLPVEWHGRSVLRDDGELDFLFGIGVDLTERKRAEEQLRERERQYRAIFDATGDGLVINDLEAGIVVEANPAACRMHGYAHEEFVGLHPTTFIHPDYHHLFAAYLDAIKAGGEFQGRAIDLRKDGTPFHVEVRGTGFTYSGRPHLLGVLRDVTEQEQARQLLEQRVEERTRELSTLLGVSHNVASTLELKPLLDLVLDQLKTVVDYHGSTILTLEGEALTILGARGDTAAFVGVPGLRFPVRDAPAIWEPITRREPVIISDVRGEGELARAYRGAVGDLLQRPPFSEIRSWLAVPLALKDRLIGMLTVSRHEPDAYTARDAALVLAIANQAGVAIENARLYEQAQALAALEERQRLARELHDSVSQALYGIALGARTARTLLDRAPSQVAEPLDYVLQLAEAGLAEMRALIFELRPESLATEGLVAALTKQADALRARHRIAVVATLCDEPDVPLELKEPLYRVAQEALHNTVKHARAGRVELRLACGDDAISLEVGDDGVGFDPGGAFPGHLGLRSMRERVAALGGSFEVDSAPGRGTRVRARVPTRHGAQRIEAPG